MTISASHLLKFKENKQFWKFWQQEYLPSVKILRVALYRNVIPYKNKTITSLAVNFIHCYLSTFILGQSID
jgi:hypothetical protein